MRQNNIPQMMITIRIQDLRKQRGITQSKLAKQIGISRSSVNAWEAGKSMPSVGHLVALADIFNVSTDYLLGREPKSLVHMDNLSNSDARMINELITRLKEK